MTDTADVVLERIKVALQVRGTDRSYVDWAKSLVRVLVCAEKYLEDMGPCPESTSDNPFCPFKDCTYCNLARAVCDV